MWRLLDRRLRYVADGESGVAQVGLRLALAEFPPFKQEGVVERDAREGGAK